ncbi:hypothetical protein J6590_079523 [Homalodisca vitripennis]|nr:hypothetical protein J6590_079523 [Homalodisca vitripennis]
MCFYNKVSLETRQGFAILMTKLVGDMTRAIARVLETFVKGRVEEEDRRGIGPLRPGVSRISDIDMGFHVSLVSGQRYTLQAASVMV